MLLRLAYLGITNAFALLRLLPADRAWLAALLHRPPTPTLRGLRLLVRPDTILRWHRDLVARRHAAASRPRRRGRPRTVRSIRVLVLRLVQENPSWGYRRVHGELLTPGVKVAASTVWEILREPSIDPAPDRAATTWTQFLRSQAQALLAADFIETITLTGRRSTPILTSSSPRSKPIATATGEVAAWTGVHSRPWPRLSSGAPTRRGHRSEVPDSRAISPAGNDRTWLPVPANAANLINLALANLRRQETYALASV
jgi:hypothetical protein